MPKIRQEHITTSIADSLASLPSEHPLPIPRQSRAVVLWVVDGFGLHHWRHAEAQGLMPSVAQSNHTLLTGQSVYPSTTAAGLSSLAFAAPPSVHGALGYWIHLPEIDRAVNMLTGRDENGAVVPEALLYPSLTPTVFERLSRHGISSAVVSPAAYASSALTRWIYKGSVYLGYDAANPLTAVRQATLALLQGCRFVWLYWPYIDVSAHLNGLNSEESKESVRQFDHAYGEALKQFRLPEPVTLVVTADHGMAELHSDKVVAIEDRRVQPLWTHRWAGERRALTTELLPASLQDALEPLAAVLPQEQVWDEGWYGGPPFQPSFRGRVLTSLILAHPNFQFEQNPGRDNPILNAAHGGTTDAERSIPISIATID